MRSDRRQLYIDVSMSAGGGGTKPDGTPTPLVDMAYALRYLGGGYPRLVLDPHDESRWTLQCALRDAFGWDGAKEPSAYNLQRLRDLTAAMTYLPELRVHRVVVLDAHDDCRMPHPGDDD